jgi:hypothetical protein
MSAPFFAWYDCGINKQERVCLLKQLIFVVFVLLVTHTSAVALDPDKAISQYIHHIWQTESGLPQSSILAIAQTRLG